MGAGLFVRVGVCLTLVLTRNITLIIYQILGPKISCTCN
jgi:hypothetical protein